MKECWKRMEGIYMEGVEGKKKKRILSETVYEMKGN